jgi:hypothetical protein
MRNSNTGSMCRRADEDHGRLRYMSLSREEICQFLVAGMKPVKTPYGRWRQRRLAVAICRDILHPGPLQPGDYVTIQDYNDNVWTFVWQADGYQMFPGSVDDRTSL